MKLSVITINLNNAEGLKKTIDSVLSQTYRDWEYILIDGDSTDGSVELIRSKAEQLAFWVSEPDSGIYNAMNKGIQKAKGDYCLFLNSGDFFCDKNVLEKIFETPLQEEIVYGNMMINYGNGKIVLGTQPAEVTFEFMTYGTIWHPVSFINRKLLLELNGYDESYKIVGDYDFFVHALIVKNVSSKYRPVAVAEFNTQGIGSSEKYTELHQQERERVLKKYFPEKVLKAATELNQLKQSHAVRFTERINKVPVLKSAGILIYKLVNRLMKVAKI